MRIWKALEDFTMTNLVNRTLPELYYQQIDKVKQGSFIYEYENIDKYIVNRYTINGPLGDSWKVKCELIETVPEDDGGNIASTEVVDDLSSTSGTAALSANQGRILDERITNISISGGTDIVDNLNSTLATSALSANQGRVLNERLSTVEQAIDEKECLPTGGANGQVLVQTENGPQWQDAVAIDDDASTPATTYSSEKIDSLIPDVSGLLTEQDANVLYVTKGEGQGFATTADMETALNGKTDYGHSHVIADVRELNTELSKKLDAPAGGTTGQVIVKTATGTEWADVSTNVTVVDDLTSTSETMALSANQGRILNERIDNFTGGSFSVNVLDVLDSTSAEDALSANQGRVLNEKIEAIHETEVIDDLTSTSGTAALSASQGRILDARVSGLETVVPGKMDLVSGGVAGQVLTKTDDSYEWADAPQGGSSIAVVDDLTSTSGTSALSANQGRILDEKIDGVLPSGGTAGQIMVKTNDGIEWQDAPSGGNVPDNLLKQVENDDNVLRVENATTGQINVLAKRYYVQKKLEYLSDDDKSYTFKDEKDPAGNYTVAKSSWVQGGFIAYSSDDANGLTVSHSSSDGTNPESYVLAFKSYVDTKAGFAAEVDNQNLTISLNQKTYTLPLYSYVTNNFKTEVVNELVSTGRVLPEGGNAGQIVVKTSDGLAWQDAQINEGTSSITIGESSLTGVLTESQVNEIPVETASTSSNLIPVLLYNDELYADASSISGGGGGGQQAIDHNLIYKSDDGAHTVTMTDTTTSNDFEVALKNYVIKILHPSAQTNDSVTIDDSVSQLQGSWEVALKSYADTKLGYESSVASTSVTMSQDNNNYTVPQMDYLSSSEFMNQIKTALVNDQAFISALTAKLLENAVEFSCDE